MKVKSLITCVSTVMIVVVIGASPAMSLEAPVAIDGDTFRVNGEYYRLFSVDTPEKGEPGYRKATGVLQRYLNSDPLLIKCTYRGRGHYDRHLMYCPEVEKTLKRHYHK